MNRKPIVIGSGQYNYDIIKLREYPNGFVVGKRNTYVEIGRASCRERV